MPQDDIIKMALEALKAMRDEFRALDLPYGSKAYAQATAAINLISAMKADNITPSRCIFSFSKPKIVLTRFLATNEQMYKCSSIGTKAAYGVTPKAAFLKWKWKNKLTA
jgi:hypothetical protein